MMRLNNNPLFSTQRVNDIYDVTRHTVAPDSLSSTTDYMPS